MILYADIDGSTKMSMSVPPASFATIIHIFSQEMTLAVAESGGYSLKYVGDAIIAIFPAEFDKLQASKNAVDCARFMHDVVKEGINPELIAHSMPELRIKVSIDYGEMQVVLYGKSLEHSHIDIVGYSISAAAKMISLAHGGQIVVGKNIYDILKELLGERSFSRLEADTSRWSYEGKGSYALYILK